MSETVKQICQDIISKSITVNQLPESKLIDVLEHLDNAYFNDADPVISDSDYDKISKQTQQAFPTNKYFIGVGSSERGGKVKLPYPMGSLDQVYYGDIEDWVATRKLTNTEFLLTDKLDGVSGMVIYDTDGRFQISYSRGNGFEGADTTRHTNKLKSIPDAVPTSNVAVRGEVIIKPTAFKQHIQQTFTRGDGSEYKNSRNFVAGAMNRKSQNDDIAYAHLEFIAYEIVGSNLPKSKQLNQLTQWGFKVVRSSMCLGSALTDDMLMDNTKAQRATSEFELDGLVVEVDNKLHMRRKLRDDKLNPEHAIKYKITDVDNVAHATVLKVDYRISKHGYLKPRIFIEPVELVGVTVTKCTGFNAKFIYDNHVGPGAVIEITRSGDVIPTCLNVLQPAPGGAQMPDGEWKWDTVGEGVNAVVIDMDSIDTVKIKKLVAFFTEIKAPYLKEGNITKLVDGGLDTPEDIINCAVQSMVTILGENGRKACDGIVNALYNIPLYRLIGAHSSERGIGVRRMKKISNEFSNEDILEGITVAQIMSVPGFEQNTADATFKALESFRTFYEKIDPLTLEAEVKKITVSAESFFITPKNICFTGFRDEDLQLKIEAMGSTISSSVSGKTDLVVAKDTEGTSSKLNKARKLGIRVVNGTQLEELVG